MKKEQAVCKKPLAEQLHGGHASLLAKYCDKTLGAYSVRGLVAYEAAHLLCANLPGAVGYLLRKFLYGRLFQEAGSGLVLGRGLTLRHPGKMRLGSRVAIDDYTMLDASGVGGAGLVIEDDVIISRNCIVQGKNGPIHIGKRCDIGCNVVLSSVSGITLGDAVLIAGNCYLGGGRYFLSKRDVPVMDQGVCSRGPLTVGTGTWLGAGAIVLDGVTIGRGCVVGAGSLVTKDLPDYAVAMGVPARVVRIREEETA